MRLVIISLKGCLKKLTKLSRRLAMFLLPMLYCKEQFSVLANHYRNEIFDEYNGDTVHTNCLISKNDQQAEVQYFVTEFNETFEKLKANVLEEANHKL